MLFAKATTYEQLTCLADIGTDGEIPDLTVHITAGQAVFDLGEVPNRASLRKLAEKVEEYDCKLQGWFTEGGTKYEVYGNRLDIFDMSSLNKVPNSLLAAVQSRINHKKASSIIISHLYIPCSDPEELLRIFKEDGRNSIVFQWLNPQVSEEKDSVVFCPDPYQAPSEWEISLQRFRYELPDKYELKGCLFVFNFDFNHSIYKVEPSTSNRRTFEWFDLSMLKDTSNDTLIEALETKGK